MATQIFLLRKKTDLVDAETKAILYTTCLTSKYIAHTRTYIRISARTN